MSKSYRLLDSGNQKKLEQFGEYRIIRPCAPAVWSPELPTKEWDKADALFAREERNAWENRERLPERWQMELEGLQFHLSPTDFGHLGVFPEHSMAWRWMDQQIQRRDKVEVLNLFAYSGGATLAAARAGASVCHLDASKGMVAWARENAALNGLEDRPIRWIVDDVTKFLAREKKRGRCYDGIILDPPSFGRGSKGEMFKIEHHIVPLLQACRDVLSDSPLFLMLSCHTPGFSPIVLHHLVAQLMRGKKGAIECGEMQLPAEKTVFSVPNGTYARWSCE